MAKVEHAPSLPQSAEPRAYRSLLFVHDLVVGLDHVVLAARRRLAGPAAWLPPAPALARWPCGALVQRGAGRRVGGVQLVQRLPDPVRRRRSGAPACPPRAPRRAGSWRRRAAGPPTPCCPSRPGRPGCRAGSAASICSRRSLSSVACGSAALTIRSISVSLRPLDASIRIFCSLPVALSLADTCRMPLASMSNVTSTCGMPRGAGGMP